MCDESDIPPKLLRYFNLREEFVIQGNSVSGKRRQKCRSLWDKLPPSVEELLSRSSKYHKYETPSDSLLRPELSFNRCIIFRKQGTLPVDEICAAHELVQESNIFMKKVVAHCSQTAYPNGYEALRICQVYVIYAERLKLLLQNANLTWCDLPDMVPEERDILDDIWKGQGSINRDEASFIGPRVGGLTAPGISYERLMGWFTAKDERHRPLAKIHECEWAINRRRSKTAARSIMHGRCRRRIARVARRKPAIAKRIRSWEMRRNRSRSQYIRHTRLRRMLQEAQHKIRQMLGKNMNNRLLGGEEQVIAGGRFGITGIAL